MSSKLRVVFVVFALSSLVFLGASALVTNQVVKLGVERSTRPLLGISARIAANAAAAGIQLESRAEVATALKSFTEEGFFTFVSVTTEKGEEILRHRKPGMAELATSGIAFGTERNGEVFYSVPVTADGKDIGKLILGASLDDRDRALASARLITALTGLPLLIVSVMLMRFYFRRSVEMPLRATVAELRRAPSGVVNGASQVSASSQSVAHGSSQQAASLEETSASSEEINSMAAKNSEISRTAADLVLEAQHGIGQANQSLDKMVVAIDEINAQSGKISKIIKVIDEIAFQTNILALNAAVEAARAGEAGLGFAVVADEVRSLAQRSAQAAKDTSVLIEESITKSHDGKIRVDEASTAIRAITKGVAKVKNLVDEVNAGSQEQARGIGQISKTITEMERITQQNAASAEESAAASGELATQSDILRQITERLTAMVGGEAGSAATVVGDV